MKMTFFNKAKEEMEKSDYSGNARIGCAVYYKGTLLAKGHNTDKTCPLQKKYNRYRFEETNTLAKGHAEIMALKKIRWLDINFSQVEVYTYRALKDGTISMARPCESCMAFIKELNIKKICYSTNEGFAEERLTY